MSSNVLLTLCILCFISTGYVYTYRFQVPYDDSNKNPTDSAIRRTQNVQREKRDVEKFDDEEYASARNQDEQDEPGFWDRIVSVALKLFNRFIEWLNSS